MRCGDGRGGLIESCVDESTIIGKGSINLELVG